MGVSFKLMPALNRIIVSTQNIRNASVSLNKISNEVYEFYENIELINELKKDKVNPVNFEDKILLKNIKFKYPSKNIELFNNLNLEIKKGNHRN